MIHQYKFDNLNIVLDVASGSIHLVDEIAYDIISLFESETKENVIESISKKYSDVASKSEVI